MWMDLLVIRAKHTLKKMGVSDMDLTPFDVI